MFLLTIRWFDLGMMPVFWHSRRFVRALVTAQRKNAGVTPSEPVDCWGCGKPLIFRTLRDGRVLPFLAANPTEVHICPRPAEWPPVFLPAMEDFGNKVKCAFPSCRTMVYQVPARSQMKQFDYRLQFERVALGLVVHPHGLLKGIWDYRVQSLTDHLRVSSEPKPHRLVVAVSVKPIPSPEVPMQLIALKSVSGRRFCSFFIGEGSIACGDLAVVCGTGPEQRLVITCPNNSVHVVAWDGAGHPGNLGLSWHWLEGDYR